MYEHLCHEKSKNKNYVLEMQIITVLLTASVKRTTWDVVLRKK